MLQMSPLGGLHIVCIPHSRRQILSKLDTQITLQQRRGSITASLAQVY